MGQDTWTKLALPFPEQALEWRTLRLDDEGLRAEVRPQLRVDAVLRRLDETVGVAGWSNTLLPVGSAALACTLTVEGVGKSAAAKLGPGVSETVLADDALVYAAELFHMLPNADLELSYWVDYDKESQAVLYEPSPTGSAPTTPATTASVEEARLAAPSPDESSSTDHAPSRVGTALPETPPKAKPAGQQAIDRLVDRLKEEGLGLEAAKLVIAYDGYGTDPDAARELYAKLRELLRGGA